VIITPTVPRGALPDSIAHHLQLWQQRGEFALHVVPQPGHVEG